MIPAILAPILTTLASNGLSILAGAITAKGKDVIEEKLGVKIPDDASKLTPELVAQLKAKEMEHEEFLIGAQLEQAKIDLEYVKEDNRNTADARDMNARIQESDKADHIAKVAAYYLDFIIVLATIMLATFLFFIDTPKENKELLYTAFGSLITMCMTILNFHRGTSSGSRKNQEALRNVSMRRGDSNVNG